jgi:hypothetical protein
MIVRRSLGLALLLVVSSPAAARADWLVMPFVALDFGGATSIVDLEQAAGNAHLTYGAAVGWLGEGILGWEADFAYTPGFFETDEGRELVTSSHVVSLMGNLIVATPLSWTNLSLRPFLSGGFGAIQVSTHDGLNVFTVDRTLYGFNAGGGALGFISDRTGLRWDLRYFRNIKNDEAASGVGFGTPSLSYWRASMAVVLRY